LTDQEIEALAAMGVVANPYGPVAAPADRAVRTGWVVRTVWRGLGGAGGDQPPKEMQVPSFPPDSTQKLLIVGDLAFRRGSIARAQSAYERALAMEPESAACQLAIAEVGLRDGPVRARGRRCGLHRAAQRSSTLRTMIERNGLYPNPAAIDRARAELTQAP
jgi:hypothetical protein